MIAYSFLVNLCILPTVSVNLLSLLWLWFWEVADCQDLGRLELGMLR